MVPTAEVPLTGIHMDEILDEGALPLHYTAYTPCFRREKMSAGRDVRGIKRGHQFDKVEMYKFCKPDDSRAEFDKMVADAENDTQMITSGRSATSAELRRLFEAVYEGNAIGF